jgi:hypothetical protein
VQNFHPWTEVEFKVAFLHQKTSELKRNLHCSLLPAVLWDVIVAYGVAEYEEVIQTMTNHMVALTLFVTTFEVLNVPQIVQCIVNARNMTVTNAVFLIVFCKTFGQTGLKLICKSISQTASFIPQPCTFPLRSVLLHCFLELDMLFIGESITVRCFQRITALQTITVCQIVWPHC